MPNVDECSFTHKPFYVVVYEWRTTHVYRSEVFHDAHDEFKALYLYLYAEYSPRWKILLKERFIK